MPKRPGWRTKPRGQGPDPGMGEQANPVPGGHSTTMGPEPCASRLSAHSPRDRGSGCRVEVQTLQVKKQGILQKLAKSSHYTETRRTRAAGPEKEQSGRTHTARFQKILPCSHDHGSVTLLWTDTWISGTGWRARDQPPTYTQSIFCKGTKAIKRGKESSAQDMRLGPLNGPVQKEG